MHTKNDSERLEVYIKNCLGRIYNKKSYTFTLIIFKIKIQTIISDFVMILFIYFINNITGYCLIYI